MLRQLNRVAGRQIQKMSSSSLASLPVRHKTILATEDAPAAIGPYSQGVKANGFVYVSGSLGLDPKTMDFAVATEGRTDVEQQTKTALDNMAAVLKAGDSSMDQVIKTTVLIADMDDFPAVNAIYAQYFPVDTPPARACFAVKTLPKNALVEIEAIATHN